MKRQFFIAGVQFRPKVEINAAVREMKKGDKLLLKPEPTNKFDPNAVQIWLCKTYAVDETVDDALQAFLGYVPKKFSSEVSAMLGIGAPVVCTVDEVNSAAKTYEMFKVTVSIPVDEEEQGEDEGVSER
ncbi:MAG: HIRAN domain-containing protein [Thermoplasmata archaeon]|nr:HIRAN domain-containing protein [Thermoplasmata archaeon]